MTEQDRNRGEPPDGGQDPPVTTSTDLPPADPSWRPSGVDDEVLKRLEREIRERPRDKLWFPKLLIRGTPGDTGQRPLWEPTPCWLSPDIHLLAAGAPIDLSQTVQSPTVGQEYTVAVHVWNLSRFPAFGVLVRAWWVEPGFFAGTPDPKYQPHFIGGTFTELGDRDSGEAHRVVPIPQPWLVEDQADAHECLFAVVDAFADPWSGSLSSNTDRHVGQRNLSLIRANADVGDLLDRLGGMVEANGHLVVLDGDFRAADLRGVVQRGMARSDDTQLGAGPIVLRRARRVAEVVRRDDRWMVARRGDPLAADRLSTTIAMMFGAESTTAAGLLAGKRFGGLRRAALHLATAQTGYTVLLSDQ